MSYITSLQLELNDRAHWIIEILRSVDLGSVIACKVLLLILVIWMLCPCVLYIDVYYTQLTQ